MMAEITIPLQHLAALKAIAELPDPSIDRLIEALSQAPFSRDLEEMKVVLQLSLPEAERTTIANILNTVLALYDVRSSVETPLPTFAKDLADSMRRLVPEWTDEDSNKFSSRLEKVLKSDRLEITSKARALRTEFERTFCDAKIVTDIRPVFGSDPKRAPVGAFVTHTLKLEYHDNSGHSEIYIGLNFDDIIKLETVISRAKDKADSLQHLLATAGLPEIGVTNS